VENWPAKIGANVRGLRSARGLTQERLAHDVGIDLTYMGGIERGQRNPSLRILVAIADVLGVDLRDLFV
jgi:transcriptional regulator with XRE-family HTH domain